MLEYVLGFLGLYSVVFYSLLYLSERDRLREDPPPRRKPQLSVIIPAYNEEKGIGKTIDSVLALNYPKKLLEVIVVNDGSKDGTAGIAKGYKVKLINKKNTGKANSINVALKEAKGELVAIMDADSYASRNSLLNMVGYFEQPDVAAVTATLKVWDPKTRIQRLQIGEYQVVGLIKKLQSFIDGISVTPGPFSIYRRSVLLELGGFDENTLTEDQEIALRIQRANLRIENSFNAEVFTEVPEGVWPLLRQRRRWCLGYLQNMWKHRALFSPRYGDFGLFVLPVATSLVILAAFSFFINYAPKSTDFSVRFESAPQSLFYLELTPIRVVFAAIFIANALAVYYTIRSSRESGFLGSFLSLSVISTFTIILWLAVLFEQALNVARGIKPAWRGD